MVEMMKDPVTHKESGVLCFGNGIYGIITLEKEPMRVVKNENILGPNNTIDMYIIERLYRRGSGCCDQNSHLGR